MAFSAIIFSVIRSYNDFEIASTSALRSLYVSEINVFFDRQQVWAFACTHL